MKKNSADGAPCPRFPGIGKEVSFIDGHKVETFGMIQMIPYSAPVHGQKLKRIISGIEKTNKDVYQVYFLRRLLSYQTPDQRQNDLE